MALITDPHALGLSSEKSPEHVDNFSLTVSIWKDTTPIKHLKSHT